MRSLFFGLILLFFAADAEAQAARGSNIAPTVPGSAAARNNQLLIDKNNYKDPQLFNTQSGTNNPINLNSLLNIYPIVGFTPGSGLTETVSLKSINNIKLIDARFDTEKIGFLPVGNDLQKKGYTSIGIQINKDMLNWLREDFINKNIVTNDTSNRQLVMVIQKFRISNSAVEHYTVSNPKLITTLQYQFDIFSFINQGYYPQKKISGSISTLYNNGNALQQLTDSILSKLRTELESFNFKAKETETNWQSPVDFNDYYNTRFRTASHFENSPKGVYASYQDFLNKKPICDSTEMIKKFTNYDRVLLYACILTGFKDGSQISCNQSWGYFDGTNLFVNAGSGFFIKLIHSRENYIFFNLKNIQQDNIKKDILEGMKFGETPYLLLRDYTKVFALTYQLDPENGKLF